jgi:hypothetical protein
MKNSDSYSAEPADKESFTRRLDRAYSLIARPYDIAVK